MQKLLQLFFVGLVAGGLTACGSGGNAAPKVNEGDPPPADDTAEVVQEVIPTPQNLTATIKGKVTLKGVPPAMTVLKMLVAECITAHPNGLPKAEDVVTGPGGSLANCFVHIKKGVSGRFPRPKEPVTLDQKGCMYKPHIVGLRPRQTLLVTTSDPTLHNVHTLPKLNPELNKAQKKGDPPLELSFRKAEVMVKVKCEVHTWMNAYIGVVDHPYFAITGADGMFEFPEKIAPGTYTVEVWHEFYKTKTQEITVGAGDTEQTVNFEFSS